MVAQEIAVRHHHDPPGTVPYAELHAHSNFSFLDGASHPEELAEQAGWLGLEAMALTDHDGFYGVVRFAEAARAVGMPTVFGTELSLGLTSPQGGTADPGGTHLLVLARNPEGYRRLAGEISAAQLAGGEKGKPCYEGERLAAAAGGHWLVLTGCRKGAIRRALASGDPAAARRELDRLAGAFGRDNVAVELTDSGRPGDGEQVDTLAELADRAGLPAIATGNVHCHSPGRSRLAGALAAIRARRPLTELDGWLPPAGAHLRSGAEMAAIFARHPRAVTTAAELGRQCAFDLALVAPQLPDFPVPAGHTEASFLRELTYAGARKRYGERDAERIPGAWAQIDHELALIEALGFPGYFLIVAEITEFARGEGILCQGRGSAACSAVCYALGITSVDAVRFGLLFERFLSPERDGYPDIDVDFEADRREEVIQHVYARYGRDRAAQVANVITYRPRLAVREMAKALGHPVEAADAFANHFDGWQPIADVPEEAGVPGPVLDLATQVQRFPRHLGIHSGGMVVCDRPVGEVCPTEWARMPGRSVLQWDKDDCAAAGLVKIDLLGLGMLSALHRAFDLVASHHGRRLDLASIPAEDPAVYDMLCEADSIGVFQVESRAQMATLPRLAPRCFYDLVVEVALIRPGPIQGGSVHPYLRRRKGDEPVSYLHPLLERSLSKTLGVPLFQEQLMQMAIDVAGFSPAESDLLRQAIGSKRSAEKMADLHDRLVTGMHTNGVRRNVAEQIYDKLLAFATFGFPESHAISFAHLVYASAWLKRHYPAAFCAALLNSQPMGFYSPQSLVADARRHGVEIRGPDLHQSAAEATLEPRNPSLYGESGESAEADQGNPAPLANSTGGDGFGTEPPPAIRLGLSSVRGIGEELAKRIAAGAPYDDPADLARRVQPPAPALEALATAGALGCLGLDRREALWSAGAAAGVRADQLDGTTPATRPPELPALTETERTVADLWATGVTPGGYPTELVRAELDALGVVTATTLRTASCPLGAASPRPPHAAPPPGSRVLVAGVVTHRQRPATARGTVFVNLEDETGQVNVICSPGLWQRHRLAARGAAALLVRGRVERADGVTNVVADKLTPLPVPTAGSSRDFR